MAVVLGEGAEVGRVGRIVVGGHMAKGRLG